MASSGLRAVCLAILLCFAAAASQPDCSKQIMELQPCLAYVNKDVSIPSSDCCKGLQSVHTNKPVCLCILMSSGNVNDSTASMLPNICKVDTDPSRCPALLKGDDSGAPPKASGSTVPASGGKSADANASSAFRLMLSAATLFAAGIAATLTFM